MIVIFFQRLFFRSDWPRSLPGMSETRGDEASLIRHGNAVTPSPQGEDFSFFRLPPLGEVRPQIFDLAGRTCAA